MPTPSPTPASRPDDPALLRIEGPIATITLNRPAAFNSIDLSIAQKLEALGAEVEANNDVRVLVIEGVGRAFSAGGDLQTIGAAAEADTGAHTHTHTDGKVDAAARVRPPPRSHRGRSLRPGPPPHRGSPPPRSHPHNLDLSWEIATTSATSRAHLPRQVENGGRR